MRVELNGEPREIADGTTVGRLLEELGIKGERVAVEVNLEVVRRDRRASHELRENDRIEVVSFVGGGC